MLYVQLFQDNRLNDIRDYQRLQLSTNHNFSLCSNQYLAKFPQLETTPNNGYPRNQTLFFLSRKSQLETDKQLSVEGKRVRTQPDSFWAYYSGNKSTNENQSQTGLLQKNKTSLTGISKNSIRDDDKQISNENNPSRWYHQISRNVSGLTKTSLKRNQVSTSFSLPIRTSQDSNRPTTAPLISQENLRRSISDKLQPTSRSHSQNPRENGLTDPVTNSSLFHYTTTTILENENPNREQLFDSSFVMYSSNDNDHDNINRTGFQHIVNLGNWQRKENVHEIDYEDEASTNIYEYKSPFSDEYDQAIVLQGQSQTNNNNNNNVNEWNLKDFYHDVKTPFEPDTNTKDVFEKCLKLSKLQANTIKWEQRRRQNLNMYNRLLKTTTTTTTFDNNSSNLNELKRELRCNECKRIGCLGNCAPGHEYNQYKRFIPISTLSITRELNRTKLGLRTQRSMIDIRPRSSHQNTRTEQININPVVVVPLFKDETQTKPSTRKLTYRFLPGRSFRSQRKETLTFLASNKVLT